MLGLFVWEPTGCASGPHKRSNGTFAASFRSFLCGKKRTGFSFAKGRKYVLFSTGRKDTKRAAETPSRTPSCNWEAHTHGSKGVAVLARLAQATRINWKTIYTHLKRINTFHRITMQCCRIAGQRREGNKFDWHPRARRQGARRVSALQHDIQIRGGG